MNQTSHGKVFDLICGMEIDRASAKFTSEYGGEQYYFCSKSCKEHFDADPKKYTG